MIRIRPARPADAPQLAAIYAPYVATGIVSMEESPPGAEEMAARMAAAGDLYPWLVATGGDEDTVLGYAYATAFRARRAYRWAVETTVYVAGDLHRQGVGRLLYEALIDTLRAQRFTQAIAAIALPNDASIGLHESVGFRRAGVYREVGWKDGRWVDVGLWQASLAEPETPPVEPRPFSEIGLVREP
ncbi:GNAT family N-acetyltransferase [Sphingomonas changnyeongensis]|uniref:GNAT family N-acetyltransferase n=2 Tax=Sphingomonas changnyeongensis TaxID=2698679 RepID=A0A7Z2NYZ8_9SPHN|nr:GNAT family N-acetyltransferase [Sphingomonas changnyeongensis]